MIEIMFRLEISDVNFTTEFDLVFDEFANFDCVILVFFCAIQSEF